MGGRVIQITILSEDGTTDRWDLDDGKQFMWDHRRSGEHIHDSTFCVLCQSRDEAHLAIVKANRESVRPVDYVGRDTMLHDIERMIEEGGG